MAMMFSPLIEDENKREEILAEWEKSKLYPRKKKKAVRKRLKIEYAFLDELTFYK
jgi:hypothetical protein